MLHTDKLYYVLPHQILLRRPHQEGCDGRACGNYGKYDKCVEGFWRRKFEVEVHLGDLDVEERVILKLPSPSPYNK